MQWQDARTFPALDAARRARRTPHRYYVIPRRHVVEIIVDAFFVPSEVAGHLTRLYADYVEWWKAETTAERRWFPRDGIGLDHFNDFVHLVVLREHAAWWTTLLNEAAPLTYNRWRAA